MKVWITKSALTHGIIEKEAELCLNIDPTGNMIDIIGNPYHEMYHGKGKEWHDNKESAIERAEEMRKNKIASLQKQMKKLENLSFTGEKPQKTFLADFMGKYPNVKLTPFGFPDGLCPNQLGYVDEECQYIGEEGTDCCYQCWTRPLEENK